MRNIYKYYEYIAKAKYHHEMIDMLSSQIGNEPDYLLRNRLCARRTHHRKLYRKYHTLAEAELFIKREPHGQE